VSGLERARFAGGLRLCRLERTALFGALLGLSAIACSSTDGSTQRSLTTNGGAPSAAGTDPVGSEAGGGSDAALGGAGGAGAGVAGAAGNNQMGAKAVSISPGAVHVAPSGMQQFSASINGSSNVTFSWSVQEGASGGSITDTGLYTAPAATGTYHVVATNKADASASASATVLVNKAGDCANLPAVGTWENISPLVTPDGNTSGKNYSESIVVDPFDSATVYWGSGYGGIFKSTDCGSTWAKINLGRGGADLDRSAVGSMALDPLHAGVMYATAFEGANGLFKSIDGGANWDQLMATDGEVAKAVPRTLVNSVAMQVDKPEHLVVSMHAGCQSPYGKVCEAESLDAGKTWTVTTVPMATDDYAPGAGAFILNESSWLFGAYSAGLWLTTDHGVTWRNVTPTGSTGSTAGKTLVLPFSPNPVDGKYYLPSMEGVLQSTDATGTAWSLIPKSGGRTVGLVMGEGNMYSSDQWSPTYHVAALNAPTTWTTLAPPAGLAQDKGAPYLALDATHHILYSSNFAAGLWRVVTQ